jgi:hypothetical protein
LATAGINGAIIAALPPLDEIPDAAANRAAWARWQAGLSVRFTLLEALPPLRVLLILDTLAGPNPNVS